MENICTHTSPSDVKLQVEHSFATSNEERSCKLDRKSLRQIAIDWTIATALAILLFTSAVFVLRYESSAGHINDFPGHNAVDSNDGDHPWTKIKAQKHLHYEPCYEGFQCARLELPLDYKNKTNSETIGLAVIRYPAPVPVDDPRYGGVVIINPGGPGGSGVDFARVAGLPLQSILSSSSENGKAYDIISFDPRGVARSTPQASCISETPALYPWILRLQAAGIIGSSENSLSQLFSMLHAQGAACVNSENSKNTIKEHMTTVSVVTDMLELVERHGEWRERTRKSKCSSPSLLTRILKFIRRWRSGSENSDLQLTYKPELEKLQYWGFSYGTLVGATFATMFPSRVGRMVLDGVVDMKDYYATGWLKNLNDTEKTMQAFYDFCAASDPSDCPLATNATTPAAVEEKLNDLLARLKQSPLALTTQSTTPEIITYSDVKSLIFISLYTPAIFPFLGQILGALADSEGSSMAELLHYAHTYNCGSEAAIARQARGLAAQLTIICTDGRSVAHETLADAEAQYAQLLAQSPTGAGVWTAIHISCAAFPLRAAWRFEGPLDGEVETAAPVLWVGNDADPVTPVGNARAMAARFKGSRVVRIGGAGHCSLSAGYSECFLRRVRAYFQEGAMPEEKEEFCPVDFKAADMSSHGFRPMAMDTDIEEAVYANLKTAEALEAHGLGRNVLGGSLGRFTAKKRGLRD